MNKKSGLDNFISKYVKLLVIMGVFLGATSATLGKAITAPSIAIGFWRLAMGLPFFAVPVLTKNRDELLGLIRNPDPKIRRYLLLPCLSGAVLFAHFTTWFNGVKMTNIASAAVLGALHPLVVLAISMILYKKRIGIKPIIGIVITIFGACLTAGLDYSNLAAGHFMGDIMAFLSAVFMGIYFSIGEGARKVIPGNIYVFILFLVCCLCFFMAMFITGTPFFSYPPKDFLLLVLMTLFCQIGSHAVYNLCLGHVDSVYVSTWGTGDTVFTILISFIFLGSIPTAWQLVGCAFVVAGLLYYNISIGRMDKNLESNRSQIETK